MFYKKRWVPYSETFLCYDLSSETHYKCVISILPTLYGACITLIWSRKEVVAIAYKKDVFTSTWTPLRQSVEGSQVLFQITFCKTSNHKFLKLKYIGQFAYHFEHSGIKLRNLSKLYYANVELLQLRSPRRIQNPFTIHHNSSIKCAEYQKIILRLTYSFVYITKEKLIWTCICEEFSPFLAFFL